MSSDPVAEKLAEIKRLTDRLLPLRGPNGPRKPALLAEHVAEFVPPLRGAVEAVLKLADEAIPALGLTPADCTDACDSGACDCSGTARVVAWNLDPAKVREAITAALREGGGDE